MLNNIGLIRLNLNKHSVFMPKYIFLAKRQAAIPLQEGFPSTKVENAKPCKANNNEQMIKNQKSKIKK